MLKRLLKLGRWFRSSEGSLGASLGASVAAFRCAADRSVGDSGDPCGEGSEAAWLLDSDGVEFATISWFCELLCSSGEDGVAWMT